MDYKRKFRQMPDETKAKISQSLHGRRKSADHVKHISDGVKKYWEQIPDDPGASAQNNKLSNTQPNENDM